MIDRKGYTAADIAEVSDNPEWTEKDFTAAKPFADVFPQLVHETNQPQIGPDTPLRLVEAAKIAFPTGTMTVAGLRKERDRGRLTVFRIAGKDYTTLRAIEEMIKACQLPKKSDSGSAPRAKAAQRPGSSATDRAKLALDALNMRLNRPIKKVANEIGRSGATSTRSRRAQTDGDPN